MPIWKSHCAHLHLILFLTQTALCPFENGCAHLKNLVCPFGENGNAQIECPNQCAHLTFSVVFNTNRKWAHCNGHCPGHCNGHCPGHCNGHCARLCLGHCNGHHLVATRNVLRKCRAVAAASASCSAQRAVTMPCPTQRVLTLPARLLYQICRRQPCGALCPCRAPGAPWRSIGLRGAREAHGPLWGPMGPHRASSMGPYGSIGSVGLQRAP